MSAVILNTTPNLPTIAEKKPEKKDPIGKVDLLSLSYFNSHCFQLSLASSLISTAATCCLHSLPLTRSLSIFANISTAALWTTTTALAAAALSLVYRKEIVYEVSLLYTILNRKDWWNEIDEQTVLGAIPLEQHLPQLKALGITHVVVLVELHELIKGLVRPISKELWEANGIECIHIPTQDFLGVPPEKLAEANTYITNAHKKDPKNKVYVHCKAGRGRSVSVVLTNEGCKELDKWNAPTPNFQEFFDQRYNKLKEKRPQINLNSHQTKTNLEFLESYFKALQQAHRGL